METGNRAEARRLWERSLALSSEVGDVAEAASTLENLARLEALEGNGERALELARQSVRQFEAIGYVDAERARGVL